MFQFLKDLTSQSKSIVTNLCQIFVPVVLISFAGIIQIVMNYLIHKNSTMMPGSDSLQIPTGKYLITYYVHVHVNVVTIHKIYLY